jgi:hypothetical protein
MGGREAETDRRAIVKDVNRVSFQTNGIDETIDDLR